MTLVVIMVPKVVKFALIRPLEVEQMITEAISDKIIVTKNCFICSKMSKVLLYCNVIKGQ